MLGQPYTNFVTSIYMVFAGPLSDSSSKTLRHSGSPWHICRCQDCNVHRELVLPVSGDGCNLCCSLSSISISISSSGTMWKCMSSWTCSSMMHLGGQNAVHMVGKRCRYTKRLKFSYMLRCCSPRIADVSFARTSSLSGCLPRPKQLIQPRKGSFSSVSMICWVFGVIQVESVGDPDVLRRS